jgi:hypothetical protein
MRDEPLHRAHRHTPSANVRDGVPDRRKWTQDHWRAKNPDMETSAMDTQIHVPEFPRRQTSRGDGDGIHGQSARAVLT